MRSTAKCAVGYRFLIVDISRDAQLIVSEHAGVIESTNDPRVNKEDIIL